MGPTPHHKCLKKKKKKFHTPPVIGATHNGPKKKSPITKKKSWEREKSRPSPMGNGQITIELINKPGGVRGARVWFVEFCTPNELCLSLCGASMLRSYRSNPWLWPMGDGVASFACSSFLFPVLTPGSVVYQLLSASPKYIWVTTRKKKIYLFSTSENKK